MPLTATESHEETPAIAHAQPVTMGGLEILGIILPGYREILPTEALNFIGELERRFGSRRKQLLNIRKMRQHAFDGGTLPDFWPQTREIRANDWTVAPIPADLRDRKVEMTGPVERKMVINGLNSGARMYMADFEDSSAPTWKAMVDGQINMRDAVNGTINYTSPQGKLYQLNRETAVLIVRPRGWHMREKHVLLDGEPISASLFDFGLFFFHNARNLINKGTGPYFYLPKMESYLEARLWNEVFVFAQNYLGVPQGTIRATVLIETITAAFEMDEILWELRDHSAGLNCGRWDYIFSFIKCFRNRPEFVLPERSQITMGTHFMNAYSELLIQICHRRGIHAMGGMAAQIPIKEDQELNEKAMAKVHADKEREARNGHDGTWVGHPGLVSVAMEVFNKYMPGPNQIDNKREDVKVTQADLLKVPEGTITRAGFEGNINAALRYTESWLGGQGCVPIFHLMEDAATAEIARAQIWQWIRYPKGVLDNGKNITIEMFREALARHLLSIREELGDEVYESRNFQAAGELLDRLITNKSLPAFLTLEAYGQL
ncbi:MAG: aceB [Gammaproteobacteria bacterium]|nr:aceB [Gammaproteobacteria bacterium]